MSPRPHLKILHASDGSKSGALAQMPHGAFDDPISLGCIVAKSDMDSRIAISGQCSSRRVEGQIAGSGWMVAYPSMPIRKLLVDKHQHQDACGLLRSATSNGKRRWDMPTSQSNSVLESWTHADFWTDLPSIP